MSTMRTQKLSAAKCANDSGGDASTIVDIDALWGANTLSEALDGRRVDYMITYTYIILPLCRITSRRMATRVAHRVFDNWIAA